MSSTSINVDNYKELYEKVIADHAQLKKVYDELLFKYEKLFRRLVGPTKERVSTEEDAQLSLLAVVAALGRLQAGDAAAAQDVEAALERAKELCSRNEGKADKKKPTGRRDLSLEDLPVDRIVIEPPERKAPGGEKLVQIGEEVSEHVEHRKASLVRVQWVRPIYAAAASAATATETQESPTSAEETTAETDDARSSTSATDVNPATIDASASHFGAPLGRAEAPERKRRIIIADLPDRPVPRCMAGPGLLAHVLVSKFADHIPLHRQERIFKREGFPIARSTLCGWVDASASLLSIIVEAMWKDVRENAKYCIVDATGVLVQEKDRCRRCHFYVVVVPKEHVLFRFTVTNNGDDVALVLKGISGHVHADAAAVYHETYRKADDVVEVGCWAHARRKFFEALSRDRERSMTGIGFISLLYDAHREALDAKTGVADRDKRADAARPILDRIHRWATEEFLAVEEGTPIHEALGYVCRQWVPLTRFLDDGRLRMDTNPAELALRREVVGRKNWLFCGSDHGAVSNTIAVSLIASCEMNDIEPWAYLRDVLLLLPRWSHTRVLELSPKHWKETLARPETQELLDELRVLHPNTRMPPADATTPIPPVE